MSRWMWSLLLLGLASVAWGEEPEKKGGAAEGLVILKKTAEALIEAKTVSYEADYQRTGWLESRVPAIEGMVTMGEQSKHKINRYYCNVRIKPSGSEEVIELSGGSDGDEYFLIDPKSKKCHQDLDPAVQGAHARSLGRVLVREFSEPEPFAEVIKSGEVELAGSIDVSGEDCHELKLRTSDRPLVLVAVSKKDFLPRRVTNVVKNDRGEASTVLTLSNLVVNPQFARNPFEMRCPEGFTKTDDFAP